MKVNIPNNECKYYGNKVQYTYCLWCNVTFTPLYISNAVSPKSTKLYISGVESSFIN